MGEIMKSKKSQFFMVAIMLLALSMFVLFSFFRTTDTAAVTLFTKSSYLDFKNIQNSIQDRNTWSVANAQQSDLCPHLKSVYSQQGIGLACAIVNYNGFRGNYSINFTSNDLEFEGYIY